MLNRPAKPSRTASAGSGTTGSFGVPSDQFGMTTTFSAGTPLPTSICLKPGEMTQIAAALP